MCRLSVCLYVYINQCVQAEERTTIYQRFTHCTYPSTSILLNTKGERERKKRKPHDGYSDVSLVCLLSFFLRFFLPPVVAFIHTQGKNGPKGKKKARESRESTYVYVYIRTYIVLSWWWEFAFSSNKRREKTLKDTTNALLWFARLMFSYALSILFRWQKCLIIFLP